MLADRSQKALALKYVISRRWLPQLELEVSSFVTIGKSPLPITDIDVFAAIPDENRGFSNMVIDCKTKKGESPINRALWQRGLMERVDAERGICVLRARAIEADHRYTAARAGVTLLTESELEIYIRAMSPTLDMTEGPLTDIALWEEYFSIAAKYPALSPAILFSRSNFWMSDGEVEACTKAISLIRTLRPELDPAKPEHLAVVADVAALFSHALARVITSIFAAYLQPAHKDELSTALNYLLYGGRSSYEHRNRIKKLLASLGKEEGRVSDLALPQWTRLVELVRQMLDAPVEATKTPLILREMAWTFLAGSSCSALSKSLAAESRQGARFAVLSTDYLCRAAELPPEFNKEIGDRLLSASSP
jgi:hypothetical protein